MMTDRTLGIYIHVPFCERKCSYCDFLSAPASDADKKAYVRALTAQIRWAGQRYDGRRRPVVSVFFGGGTPSILPAEEVAAVLEAVRASFAVEEDAEISLEANPKTVTKEKLEEYRRCGVNRLSIGLQSSRNSELRLLGRIHTYEDFLETWALVREAGFDNVNVDLMSGLPGQSAADWEDTLSRVIDLRPEHISAYSLIVEEGTPFYDWFGAEAGKAAFPAALGPKPQLPDEETDRQMYRRTKVRLAEAGYVRYEISNYAEPGRACRHNLRYWQGGDYLGFGIGAASCFQGWRWTNTADAAEYRRAAANDNFAAVRRQEERLTRRSQMEEFMFLGLRCMEGISETEFAARFDTAYDSVYGAVTERLVRQGLLVRGGGWIRLTEFGIDVSNAVMSEFLLD